MLQVDKHEALKKALFRGDVSLIEELLNSGEEKSVTQLNIFYLTRQKLQFSFKMRLYILYWKHSHVPTCTQHVILKD